MTRRRSGIPTAEDDRRSTMTRDLIAEYREWLGAQIRNEHDRVNQTFEDLITLMFEKEFVCLVSYDDNRMADGVALRVDFCHHAKIRTNSLQELGPATFLEVLVGLSRRLAFNAGGSAPGWAWQLLTNLELHKMADPLTERKAKQAHRIVDACIWRTYKPDGQGGFFPLAWPDEDQTKVEIWYQMPAYLAEQPEH